MPDGSSSLLLDKCTPADTKTYRASAVNSSGESETSCDVKIASKSIKSNPLPILEMNEVIHSFVKWKSIVTFAQLFCLVSVLEQSA